MRPFSFLPIIAQSVMRGMQLIHVMSPKFYLRQTRLLSFMRVLHVITNMRSVPSHLIIFIHNYMRAMSAIHVIQVMRSNPFPSIIVLGAIRDMRVMRVMHFRHVIRHALLVQKTLCCVLYVLCVLRMLCPLRGSAPFYPIIIVLSVMCDMRVRLDIYFMRPNAFYPQTV